MGEKIMKLRIALCASLMTVGLAAAPQTASAQQDDIGLRLQAMEMCDQPGYWQGYASYEICVEAIYQGLLAQGGQSIPTGGGSGPSPSTTPPSGGCAASRIC
jgi:hypothetical protein